MSVKESENESHGGSGMNRGVVTQSTIRLAVGNAGMRLIPALAAGSSAVDCHGTPLSAGICNALATLIANERDRYKISR